MSTHQPGTEPTPERPDDGPAAADTQRLDPPATAAAPGGGGHDGGTRVLPGGEQPSDVDSLWDLGRPDDAAGDSPAVPEPSPAAPPAAPTAAPRPSAAPLPPERTGRRAVRVGTVVWGLVVAVGGVLALAVAGGANVDGGTVAIAILGGAGVALVLGSIVTGVRRRDRA